jgi:nucleophosmin 3
MSEEAFYGVTLTAEKNVVTWDAVAAEDEYQQAQKLVIKQVLLGADAKDGEFNVVEVETTKDSLRIPIAVLKAGETRALNPDLEFYDTDVTFKLIKGNGPVYIHGQTIKDEVMDENMDDEQSDEEEDDEEEEEEDPKKAKKQKLDNNVENKHNKNKKK